MAHSRKIIYTNRRTGETVYTDERTFSDHVAEFTYENELKRVYGCVIRGNELADHAIFVCLNDSELAGFFKED